MSTVEMEAFSNAQLIIMTILMLLGGEVFTSLVGLVLCQSKYHFFKNKSAQFSSDSSTGINRIELGQFSLPPVKDLEKPVINGDEEGEVVVIDGSSGQQDLKYNSIKSFGYVVLGYFLVVQALGSSLLSMYISLTPTAYNVLKTKGLVLQTFSIFTIVSTFTNCGFVPTNENMMVFRNNPGLLLIVLPQTFLGNTLYPFCLRLLLRILNKLAKRREYTYVLNNYKDMGYGHLMSWRESRAVAATAVGFVIVQFVIFCVMEWNSNAMQGMNTYEKLVGSLFQTTNSRHSGESIVDLSIISPAILVLFVVMMYLPPYTSFLPTRSHKEGSQTENESTNTKTKRNNITENLLFSQLSYLAIFVIIICITERKGLKEDPLNFTVLNIVIEVTSAYGNVGLSACYSCKRQLNPVPGCKDKWYGFSGAWSKEGKLVLIVVMFFGRLKRFNMGGGKAWKIA